MDCLSQGSIPANASGILMMAENATLPQIVQVRVRLATPLAVR